MDRIKELFSVFGNDLEAQPTPFKPLTEEEVREAALPRPVTAKSHAAYVSPCKRCGGSGRYIFASRYGVDCLACKGAGSKSYKTSPEQRERARANAASRYQRRAEESIKTFAEEFPAVHAWLVETAPRFDFARAMLTAIQKYGRLTEGQRAAVDRCMARDSERKAQREAQAKQRAEQPEQRMDKFFAVMLKHNKFYAGDITMSRGRDGETVWIRHVAAEKALGRIERGVLTIWNRPGVDVDAVRKTLAEFEDAPLEAAQRYGKLTGRCCSCGRELTDPASIEDGIGPICAKKF